MEKKITVIKGDGIGPEIVTEAQKVLDKVAEKFGHKFVYTDILMGGCSIDKYGVPLTDEAVEVAKNSDAVLLGSIGGNTSTSPWYKLAPNLRPEAGLLKIRKELGLFANLRPANLYPELREACPLKDDIIGDGFDMMIMRELTGGLYFGARKTENVDGVETAVDTLTYNENEIRRIAIRGFDIAMKRRKKVTSVDKANVLDSSRLWRKVVNEVAKDYPEVELEHMLVDNCAMQLVRDPKQFDVILTENMFGDILSDEAAMISGSLGMLASASLNDTKFGMYEPSHGSAPDIAGQDKANPIATILSASMLLRFSFDMDKEADAIDNAVKKVLEAGYRTGDIMSEGMKLVGCYYIFGITDKGNYREQNEDCILIDHEVINSGSYESTVAAPFIAAVCDGVGGENAGEVASELCLRHLSILEYNSGVDMKRTLINVHNKIKKQGVRAENAANMQTTLCCLAVDEESRAMCINVGDSRMYRYVNGTIRQISVDQSYARYMYEHGRIEDVSELEPQYQNAIISSIGSTLNEPDVAQTPLVADFGKEPDDMIIIVSDGVSDYVSEEEMVVGLGLDLSVSEKLGAIMELALTNGGTDNVSVVGIKPYLDDHELKTLTAKKAVEKTVSVQDMLESKKPEKAEAVEEKKPDEQAKLFSDTVDELMSQMNESIDFLKQI